MKEEATIIRSGGRARMKQGSLEEGEYYRIIDIITNGTKISNFHGYPVLADEEVLIKYFTKSVKKVAIGNEGFISNKQDKKILISEVQRF